jgi:two-component system, OmpR family, sensor kinase
LLAVRWRLTLWPSLLLGFSLVASGLLIYVVLGHQLQAEVDERLQQLAHQVHRDLNIPQQQGFELRSVSPDRLVSSTSEFSAPGLYVQILDGHGTVVSTSPNLRGEELPVSASGIRDGLRGQASVETLSTMAGDPVRVRTVPMIHGDSALGLVQVGQSLRPLNETLRWLGLLLAAGVVSVWSLTTLAGWIVVGRALDPIGAITDTAAFIAATGDFGNRIAYSGPADEVGRLAGTFNRMIDRLEATFQSQRRFIADSSHELGTPLAVIKGNADLLGRPLPPGAAEEAVAAIQAEAGRMERIVSDLLKMAEMDMAEDDRSERVRLDLLASEVFAHMRAVAVGRRFSIDAPSKVVVAGNPDRLRELVLNLLDNAIKYTQEDGRVALSLRSERSWAVLAVSDTGIGIPVSEQDRIFDRFYRVDKARSRAGGGTGLGLAITRSIVQAHGGTISVRSEPGLGSTFIVHLPLAS